MLTLINPSLTATRIGRTTSYFSEIEAGVPDPYSCLGHGTAEVASNNGALRQPLWTLVDLTIHVHTALSRSFSSIIKNASRQRMSGAFCFPKMKCVSALIVRSCWCLLISRLMFHPSDLELVTSLFNRGSRQGTECWTKRGLLVFLYPATHQPRCAPRP